MIPPRIASRPSKIAHAQEEHWIPLSDLMTGLMMMFLLIAVVFMIKVESDAKKTTIDAENAKLVAESEQAQAGTIKSIAQIYEELRTQLFNDLAEEFRTDFQKWGAELFRDLNIRFKEPDVLFDTGKDVIKPTFMAILDDFFPRYVRILTAMKYRDAIDEVRIEGHTSSTWNRLVTPDQAYFLNMELSQSRTRSVLRYVLGLPRIANQQDWLRAHLTANGLSSSKLIVESGIENKEASQRVEFRVRTKADEKISEILKAIPK
jgi:outer membrane protein OmpA-like peptidoglycan-associated protein